MPHWLNNDSFYFPTILSSGLNAFFVIEAIEFLNYGLPLESFL